MLGELRARRPMGCISDLAFDEWSAGELSAERQRELELHVAGCVGCSERRRALSQMAAAYLERAPEPAVDRARSRPGMLPASRLARYGGALALAAGVVLAVTQIRPVAELRSKGGAELGFFVSRAGRVFEGAPGERLRPGDQLRFTVSVQTPTYVAVLSRDARGVASTYFPPGTDAERVEPGAGYALQSSVALDATLGAERIYGLFCAAPFTVEGVRTELERQGKLAPRAGCTQRTLDVHKELAE